MASIIEKVKQLGLPLNEIVVIGSGLLDALGYRHANDIDLAVSGPVYESLRGGNTYLLAEKYGQEMLEASDIEIWRDWGADMPYEKLKETALVVDGVAFANPQVIINWKQVRNTPKDQQDIQNLQEYLAQHG